MDVQNARGGGDWLRPFLDNVQKKDVFFLECLPLCWCTFFSSSPSQVLPLEERREEASLNQLSRLSWLMNTVQCPV